MRKLCFANYILFSTGGEWRTIVSGAGIANLGIHPLKSCVDVYRGGRRGKLVLIRRKRERIGAGSREGIHNTCKYIIVEFNEAFEIAVISLRRTNF